MVSGRWLSVLAAPPLSRHPPSQKLAERQLNATREASLCPADELLTRLGTNLGGLTEQEAEERLESYGLNQVAQEKPPTWYAQLYHSFRNAFVVLLVVLAGISYATGDREAAIIITVMLLLSALLRFFQERRSTVAAEKLRAMVKVTATVFRRED